MGINVMLIGETKTGKTAALETLPRGVVDFSFDIGGWHSLGRRGKKVKVVRRLGEWLDSGERLEESEILVVDYTVADPVAEAQYTAFSTELIGMFIKDFNLLWKRQQECIEKGVCHIAIDSLTSFQRPILEYIIAINARVLATQQDWGQAINKVDEIVQSAVALPFDFIMTSHIQAEKDEITGKVRELPLIYGKQLPNMILAKFDDIFLTIKERTPTGIVYRWGTAPEGLLQCIGTRNFDNLPLRIEPNFTKLYGDRLFNGGER
ncbi:MAG: AAA family ATPase [Candidatus Methanosuratincola sp.]